MSLAAGISRHIGFPTVLALSVCAAQAVAQDGAYLLRYKFQPGQFLYYEVENAMTIVTQYDSAKEEIYSTSQAWKQLRVVSVDEAGNVVLEPMVERVKMMAIKDAEDPVNYDSLTDDDPPIQFRDVKKTIGKVLARVIVSSNGDLKQVTPLVDDNEPLLEAAMKNDPRLNFLVVMPATPVKIGETWKDRFTSEVTVDKGLQKNVTLQRTYQLAAVNGTIATIKLKTALITPVNDPQIELQLMQRTPSGVIKFDLDQGRIVSMETVVEQTVLGAAGPKSLASAKTESVEKLLPSRPEFKTVSRTKTN